MRPASTRSCFGRTASSRCSPPSKAKGERAGEDFHADWLSSLVLLFRDPDEDVVYVLYGRAQAIYRPDATVFLGLREFSFPDNCRNPRPIHDLAFRWFAGEVESEPLREDGGTPQVLAAEPGVPTLDALRDVLDDLVEREGIERERIAVLTGLTRATTQLVVIAPPELVNRLR